MCTLNLPDALANIDAPTITDAPVFFDTIQAILHPYS